MLLFVGPDYKRHWRLAGVEQVSSCTQRASRVICKYILWEWVSNLCGLAQTSNLL